jgi:hypothetical protein
MKLTVITERGKLVGAMHGHIEQPDGSESSPGRGKSEFRAGLTAGPGQKMQVVDVPDSLGKTDDPEKFHKALTAHLKKSKA